MRNLILVLLAIALGACAPARQGAAPVVKPPAPPAASVSSPLPALDAPAVPPVEQLRREMDAIFDDPAFANAFWGVLIQSAANGEVFYARNQHRLLMPASNMKLLTASAALLRLAPDFRYKTCLYGSGPVVSGSLQGDLVVVGSGDPTIGGRPLDENYENIGRGDPLRDFRHWAAVLGQQGITRIAGRIIGDDNAFDDQAFGPGWSWDYLGYGYAAEVGALVFNENLATVSISPAQPGQPPVLGMSPENAAVEVVNELVTVAAGAPAEVEIVRAAGSNRLIMKGHVAAGAPPARRTVAVYQSTRYFVSALRDALRASGIEVSGEAIDADEMEYARKVDSWTLLHTHESPPLDYILKVLLKVSNNLYAEMLLKTLGVPAGSYAGGRTVIESVLSGFGASEADRVIADGSGLSRYNYVTPETLVKILRALYRHSRFEQWYSYLPVAGVDGTLRSRMQGSAAGGNVHAKTGSIANVRTLSGYVRTRDGEMLAFSMMANNFTVPNRSAEYLQDLALERLANFSRGVVP